MTTKEKILQQLYTGDISVEVTTMSEVRDVVVAVSNITNLPIKASTYHHWFIEPVCNVSCGNYFTKRGDNSGFYVIISFSGNLFDGKDSDTNINVDEIDFFLKSRYTDDTGELYKHRNYYTKELFDELILKKKPYHTDIIHHNDPILYTPPSENSNTMVEHKPTYTISTTDAALTIADLVQFSQKYGIGIHTTNDGWLVIDGTNEANLSTDELTQYIETIESMSEIMKKFVR